jgi:hypothetical protein
MVPGRRHDTSQNDIKHNDVHYMNPQHCVFMCDTQYNITQGECYHAECHSAECHYSVIMLSYVMLEYQYAECHYA